MNCAAKMQMKISACVRNYTEPIEIVLSQAELRIQTVLLGKLEMLNSAESVTNTMVIGA